MERRQNTFNFNAKRVFLTYAQSALTREQVRDHLITLLKDYCIIKWCIGREEHADGGTHYHAIFLFATKCHTRDVRYFDILGEHPNIRTVDNPDKVHDYTTKDGDYEENWPLDKKGYTRTRADIEAYDRDQRLKKLADAIPFELPNEVLFTEAMLNSKKRHYWFVSAPDWGKTTWVEDTFEGKKIYKRVESNYPFDDYNGQCVIIYDDFYPDLKELLSVSNTYKTETPVYGNTRYTKRYWPLRQSRVIIVLANDWPVFYQVESFQARFNCVTL